MIKIYTDGACELDKRGCYAAIVFMEREEMVYEHSATQMFGRPTSQRAELLGLILALESVDAGENILIYSDSMYALNICNSWSMKWMKKGWMINKTKAPENLDLVQRLHELKYTKHEGNVEVVWVKGHLGHKWNERADEIAEQYQARTNSYPLIDGEQIDPLTESVPKGKEPFKGKGKKKNPPKAKLITAARPKCEKSDDVLKALQRKTLAPSDLKFVSSLVTHHYKYGQLSPAQLAVAMKIYKRYY